jgi:serine/threonine protein kinase
MWAVGAITIALFLGRPPFTIYADPEFTEDEILKNAVKCQLDFLDSSAFWQHIDHRSRDFIKKLLVLDENKRMNVAQALAHQWFTNREHKELLEEKYQQVVKGWTPRRPLLDYEEDLSKIMADRRSNTDVSLNIGIAALADNFAVSINASASDTSIPCSSYSTVERCRSKWKV